MGRLLIQFPGSTNAKVSNETLPKNTIVIDEENKQLRLHDGVTRGGFPIGDRGGTAPATTDLDNLTMTGRNIGNWSTNVSNCITKIPQDIKLELNNGTLTLKAGSKIYVPNGVGVFNAITTNNDISTTFSTNGTHLIGFAQGFGNLASYINAVSGNTEPTTLSNGLTWYDTANNVIKRAWAGSWQDSLFSLPLAVITVSNGAISSIDQVFNGFGYIGSTIYALPGIEALIPNGFNEDGTLNNIKRETKIVTLYTTNNTEREDVSISLVVNGNSMNISRYGGGFEIVDELPESGIAWRRYYVIPENRIYYFSDSLSPTVENPGSMYAGSFSTNTTSPYKVTRFNPRTAVRTVDTDEVEVIINTVFKKVSALPASPDPDTWYAIPE